MMNKLLVPITPTLITKLPALNINDTNMSLVLNLNFQILFYVKSFLLIMHDFYLLSFILIIKLMFHFYTIFFKS
jgi:hypothetical protein